MSRLLPWSLVASGVILFAAPAASRSSIPSISARPTASPIYVDDRMPVMPMTGGTQDYAAGLSAPNGGQWPEMAVDWSQTNQRFSDTYHLAGPVVDIGSWPVWHPGDTRGRPIVLLKTPQACGGAHPPLETGATWPPGPWGAVSGTAGCSYFFYSFIPQAPGVFDTQIITLDGTTVTLRGAGTDRPSVEGGARTETTSSTAVIHGRANADGLVTTAHFEYGRTSAYGARTADVTIPTGFAALPLAQTLTGLTAGSTYHFRLVATNSAGTSSSDDQIFKTSTKLTLVVRTNGSGQVASQPAGIQCGARCIASFAEGARVELRAAPAADWVFAGWQGSCHGSYSVCPLVLDASEHVTATFTRRPSP
jgi:hypothetical protein